MLFFVSPQPPLDSMSDEVSAAAAAMVAEGGAGGDEVDTFDVELTKGSQGLGITIAGYVGDKTEGKTSNTCS